MLRDHVTLGSGCRYGSGLPYAMTGVTAAYSAGQLWGGLLEEANHYLRVRDCERAPGGVRVAHGRNCRPGEGSGAGGARTREQSPRQRQFRTERKRTHGRSVRFCRRAQGSARCPLMRIMPLMFHLWGAVVWSACRRVLCGKGMQGPTAHGTVSKKSAQDRCCADVGSCTSVV